MPFMHASGRCNHVIRASTTQEAAVRRPSPFPNFFHLFGWSGEGSECTSAYVLVMSERFSKCIHFQIKVSENPIFLSGLCFHWVRAFLHKLCRPLSHHVTPSVTTNKPVFAQDQIVCSSPACTARPMFLQDTLKLSHLCAFFWIGVP